ncbi:hypothetical protein [Paenibacillus sp. Soil522]|uniref:hypothetical protein n=1 Tax=Paenibacillus sp. Soil522 TaxID=1736388 RepID=UPI00070108AC|nr:hypothetical protein [Paenibacillus sp. Soil522]KRE48080.1 hypothetical protein ASG81_07065 [Paenibacillus sp. Soil522]
MRRRIGITAILIVVLIFSFILINQKFIFNPILFEQDKITSNDWSIYKYPAQIEYFSFEDNGWTITSIVNDNKEIHFILKELKKNKETILSQSGFYKRNKEMGKEKRVVIRHLTSEKEGEGPIIFQFSYYENGNAADVGNGVDFVPISDELKGLLEKNK